ncbi:MAG: hypothetical protein M1339_03615 [Bacteroidetes bacterium]|nr:hypothetical protein [Bacteroidota bacterium]
MTSTFTPMTLGDIFERTVTMIGKTFLRNLLVAITFLALPAFLMSMAARDFYGALTAEAGRPPSFFALMPFILATILLEAAAILAEIAISYITGKEMQSEYVSFKEALADTFHAKWLSGIGQAFLKYFVVFGGLLGITLIFVTLDSETKNASSITKGVLMLFQVPFFLLLIPALLFLFYRWLFSLTAVGVDGLDSIQSLKKSWNIVDGYWWRTFGIFLLLAIIAQFAISIISLPLTFGSMWTVYRDYYTMLGKSGGTIGAGAINHYPASMGSGIGVGTAIGSVLSLLVTPVFMVVMYFDLRARHYDFPATTAETAPHPDEPATPAI